MVLANGICSQWYTKSRLCHYMEVPDLDTEIISTVQHWPCVPFPVLWTIPSFPWYYLLETEFLSLGAWYWLSKNIPCFTEYKCSKNTKMFYLFNGSVMGHYFLLLTILIFFNLPSVNKNGNFSLLLLLLFQDKVLIILVTFPSWNPLFRFSGMFFLVRPIFSLLNLTRFST